MKAQPRPLLQNTGHTALPEPSGANDGFSRMTNHWEVNCCNQAWLLKNSFCPFRPQNLTRKLLSPRSAQTQKLLEITHLVPFSTAAGDYIR
jgi:hypothetical protein